MKKLKFVKRANMYCVSIIQNQGTKEHTQEQKWFSTLEEAQKEITEIEK